MSDTNSNNIPFGGLSSFPLKVLAIVGMTCNHTAFIFAQQLPSRAYVILEGVGGLTFPTMAFLLIVGYQHTSNVRNYALRLLAFAVIAQIPYTLFLLPNPNVLFTLLVGLGLLYVYDRCPSTALYILLVAVVCLATVSFDWGFIGPLMIVLGSVLPKKSARVWVPILLPAAALGLPSLMACVATPTATLIGRVLYALVGCPAAGALCSIYNGKRGFPLKWFFYVYYPAHIAVLGVCHLLIAG